MAFREVILCRVQSFLSSQMDLKFRHLSSCDTIKALFFISTIKSSKALGGAYVFSGAFDGSVVERGA